MKIDELINDDDAFGEESFAKGLKGELWLEYILVLGKNMRAFGGIRLHNIFLLFANLRECVQHCQFCHLFELEIILVAAYWTKLVRLILNRYL